MKWFKKPTDPCAQYIEKLNRQAKERDLRAAKPKTMDRFGDIPSSSFDSLTELANALSDIPPLTTYAINEFKPRP